MNNSLNEKAYLQAKEYYPSLWGIERINKLLAVGLITKEQYDDIIANDEGNKSASN